VSHTPSYTNTHPWIALGYPDEDVVEEEYRLGLYKRIADICLFILGIFPDYVERDYRYPSSGEVRPHLRAKFRISPEDYEKEGRKFYRPAAELSSARNLELSRIFEILQENFSKAKKPLNFLARALPPIHPPEIIPISI